MKLQKAVDKATKKLKKKYGVTAIVVLDDGNKIYFGGQRRSKQS